MPAANPEAKRSTKTARAFLVTLLDRLQDGFIDDYRISPEIAFATITAPDGERYNLTLHKIQTETNKPGRRPQL